MKYYRGAKSPFRTISLATILFLLHQLYLINGFRRIPHRLRRSTVMPQPFKPYTNLKFKIHTCEYYLDTGMYHIFKCLDLVSVSQANQILALMYKELMKHIPNFWSYLKVQRDAYEPTIPFSGLPSVGLILSKSVEMLQSVGSCPLPDFLKQAVILSAAFNDDSNQLNDTAGDSATSNKVTPPWLGVTSIYLSGNDIKKVCANTIKTNYKNIVYLDLGENLIESIPGDMLTDLPYLEALMLNSNKLKTIDTSIFRPLKNLHMLSFSANPIESITGVPEDFNNLTSFSVSRAGLTWEDLEKIPRGKNVQEYYLYGNRLSYVPTDFVNKYVSKSFTFEFKDNPLFCTSSNNAFINWLDRWVKKPMVDRSDADQIKCYVPPEFKDFFLTTSLVDIKLKLINPPQCYVHEPCHCYIYKMALYMHCTFATYSYLMNKSSINADKWRHNLILEEIAFPKTDSNGSTLVPKEFLNGQLLRSVTFNRCGLNRITAGFFYNYATSLSVITLNHNKISTVEKEAFDGCTNVTSVDMSNNSISNISTLSFSRTYLPVLEYLNLSQNELEYFDCLDMNPQLKVLNLTMNALVVITEASLLPLSNLRDFYILYNFIDCENCETLKIATWLKGWRKRLRTDSKGSGGTKAMSKDLTDSSVCYYEFYFGEPVEIESLLLNTSLNDMCKAGTLKNKPRLGPEWMIEAGIDLDALLKRRNSEPRSGPDTDLLSLANIFHHFDPSDPYFTYFLLVPWTFIIMAVIGVLLHYGIKNGFIWGKASINGPNDKINKPKGAKKLVKDSMTGKMIELPELSAEEMVRMEEENKRKAEQRETVRKLAEKENYFDYEEFLLNAPTF